MELRFWLDAETGLPHIYDHGVTEEEVRQILGRPTRIFPAAIGLESGWARQQQAAICRWCTCPTRKVTVFSLLRPMTSHPKRSVHFADGSGGNDHEQE